MNQVETDNYRTKDGEAYFTFSFFQDNEFIDIDVTYCPSVINLEEQSVFCIESKRGGFTIVSRQKARDFFSARLVAGEWAESLWKNHKENQKGFIL